MASGGTVYGWKRIKVLGEGGFGKVWLVKKTGRWRAMKEVFTENEEKADALRKEINILQPLNHPNIVKYYHYVEDEDSICMFMEVMEMSVRDKLYEWEFCMSEGRACFYTVQILDGLVYLHNRGIIHRDIKCANLLLNNTEDVVKLADMGISRYHNQETLASYSYKIGTFAWVSPEVISGHQGGKRSDVWSLGCTVYEMLELEPPFYELAKQNKLNQLKREITSLNHGQLVLENDDFSDLLKDFLLDIFVPMKDRPFADEIADHEWLA